MQKLAGTVASSAVQPPSSVPASQTSAAVPRPTISSNPAPTTIPTAIAAAVAGGTQKTDLLGGVTYWKVIFSVRDGFVHDWEYVCVCVCLFWCGNRDQKLYNMELCPHVAVCDIILCSKCILHILILNVLE